MSGYCEPCGRIVVEPCNGGKLNCPFLAQARGATYSAASLEDIAKLFDSKELEAQRMAQQTGKHTTNISRTRLSGEASAWGSAARILRATKLVVGEPPHNQGTELMPRYSPKEKS